MNRDPYAWARLGLALRAAREARGFTQEELAALADVSARSIQEAEAGTVPKKRMPYTIGRIASVLGWPEGAVTAVIEGAGPPGGGHSVSVQAQVDEETATGIITSAMVQASENVTPAEIREATRLALDALRRHGVIAETDGVQPSTKRANS